MTTIDADDAQREGGADIVAEPLDSQFVAFASYGQAEQTPRSWVAALFGSSLVYVGAAALIITLSAITKDVIVEKRVDLTFVETIIKEEPPPPPAPAPVAPVAKAVPVEQPKAAPAAAPVIRNDQKVRKLDKPPPPKEMVAPKEMPQVVPQEADPSLDKGVAVYGEPGRGDPAGLEGGIAKGVVGGQVGIIDMPPDAVPPKPLKSNARPRYPESEKRKRRSGSVVTVLLKIAIHADGSVGTIDVLQGEEPFVSAAREAVKSWRYEPARLHGQPISIFRKTRVSFELTT